MQNGGQPYSGGMMLQVGDPRNLENRGISLQGAPQAQPIPQAQPLGGQASFATQNVDPQPRRRQPKKLTFDRVVDASGNTIFTPVFQGDWGSRAQMQQYLQANIPNDYGGIPVDKGNFQFTAQQELQQRTGQPYSPYYNRTAQDGINFGYGQPINVTPQFYDPNAWNPAPTNPFPNPQPVQGNQGQDRIGNLPDFSTGSVNNMLESATSAIMNYAQGTPPSIPSYAGQVGQPEINQLQGQPVQEAVPPYNPIPGQTAQSSGGPSTSGSSASTVGAIQAGANAVGDVFRGINNVQNQIISGGAALFNGLIPDNHNQRQRSPQLADPTFAYQPQYNNMYQNGGLLPIEQNQPQQVSYLPGEEVELTPEQVKMLKDAGYDFDIL